MPRRGGSWWIDAARGAVAGGVAVWVMDLATIGLASSQTKEAAAQEQAAMPNGKSSVANLVDRISAILGLDPDKATRERAAQAVHYGLGILPGALYGVARRRLPLLAAGRGVAYGTALFLGNDEFLNTKLGLSGPVDAYPPDSHLRGFVGHAVMGGATETALVLLGG